jgi:hypothetical protein
MDDPSRRTHSRWWYALLAVPFVGLLVPPLDPREDPTVIGLPFFYWYQFLWVPVAAALTWVVYRAVTGEEPHLREEGEP